MTTPPKRTAIPAPTAAPVTTEAGARLLDAAEGLFYRRGIGAVGVDVVAEAAGVTKRTLYQRFGSKGDLVAAYLQRRAHRWQVHLLAEIDAVEASARVTVVFDVAARWSQEHDRGCAFVNAWAELSGTAGPAAAQVLSEKQWMRSLFAALVDDDALAQQLHALFEGAAVLSSTMGDRHAYPAGRAAARALVGLAPAGRS